MSNKKASIKDNAMINSLTELVAGLRTASIMTGGSQLSSYETIMNTNNYSLITLNRVILTYFYVGNGLFQTAIDIPVHDALSRGIELNSSEMNSDDIDKLMEWMESPFNDDNDNLTPWETIRNIFIWQRLYGGSALIINDGNDPSTTFNVDRPMNQIELYDADRWQLDSWGNSTAFLNNVYNKSDYYFVNGIKVHKSRIIKVRGKRAPFTVRQTLRNWGLSEGERMIRDLNLYLKTKDVLFEIIDESKVDVYKIKNFAQKLIQNGGTEKIQSRVMLANMIKNFVNALILDSEEDYQQKTMSFSGLAEVMNQNMIGVASAFRIPMTKLFGLSASGFNTGESDLENYNSFVESGVREPMRPVIRTVLQIGCSYLFGYVPSFTFEYPSLRVLSSEEDERVKTSQQTRALNLYDRGIIDSHELAQMGRKEKWLTIQTKAEQGLIDLQPTPPNNGEFISSDGEGVVV